MTNEKKILQDIQNNPDFYDSIIDIFMGKNCHMGLKYKMK
jgi:hypothetical protein